MQALFKVMAIDIEKTINQVLEQAGDDRREAQLLLEDLKKSFEDGQSPKETHAILGDTATKYLKAMNKSTDQMIKLVEISLRHSEEKEEMTIDEIRDMLETNTLGSGEDENDNDDDGESEGGDGEAGDSDA